MPEGDTIFRAARALHQTLAGRTVTHFESVFARIVRTDDELTIRGRTIERVDARGKHLLIWFSGDVVLRTHLRMHGVWHLYPRGARWRRPHSEMRIVIRTPEYEAVAFNVPVAELTRGRDLEESPAVRTLGPCRPGAHRQCRRGLDARRHRVHAATVAGSVRLREAGEGDRQRANRLRWPRAERRADADEMGRDRPRSDDALRGRDQNRPLEVIFYSPVVLSPDDGNPPRSGTGAHPLHGLGREIDDAYAFQPVFALGNSSVVSEQINVIDLHRRVVRNKFFPIRLARLFN